MIWETYLPERRRILLQRGGDANHEFALSEGYFDIYQAYSGESEIQEDLSRSRRQRSLCRPTWSVFRSERGGYFSIDTTSSSSLTIWEMIFLDWVPRLSATPASAVFASRPSSLVRAPEIVKPSI